MSVRDELRRQEKVRRHAEKIAKSDLKIVATSRAALVALPTETRRLIDRDAAARASGRPIDIVKAAAEEVGITGKRDEPISLEEYASQLSKERLKEKKKRPIRSWNKGARDEAYGAMAEGREPWGGGPYETDDLLVGPVGPAMSVVEVSTLFKDGAVEFRSAQRQLAELPRGEKEMEQQLRIMRYRRRFDLVGDFWSRKLRLLRYRSSLRHAFEIPGLFTLRQDTGYMLSRTQFVSALHYAIEPNEDLVDPIELGQFYHDMFDALNVDGGHRVDYREGLVVLHFFRMPSDQSAVSFARELYRCWDGPHHGALTEGELQQLLSSICISALEVRNVLESVNWKLVRVMDVEAGGEKRFVTDRALEEIVRKSPKLRDALLRLRLARMPPLVRGALIRAKTEARVVQAQREFEKIRIRAQMGRAAEQWRKSTTLGLFRRWVAYSHRQRKVRILVDRQRATHAIRVWRKWKTKHKRIVAKYNVAHTFRALKFMGRVFRLWRIWLDKRQRRHESMVRRATRAYQHMALERCFDMLRLNRGLVKARLFRKTRVRRKYIRALRAYMTDLRGRGLTKHDLRIREEMEERRKAARLKRIEEDAVKKAEERHFATEVEMFEAEAKLRAEVEEETAKIEEEETKRRIAKARKDAAEQRLMRYQREEVIWRARFNRRWEKISEERTVEVSRETSAYLSTEEGQAYLDAEVRRLSSLRSPELLVEPNGNWKVARARNDPRKPGEYLLLAEIEAGDEASQKPLEPSEFYVAIERSGQRLRVCPISSSDRDTARSLARSNFETRAIAAEMKVLQTKMDEELHQHYGEKVVKAMIGRYRARKFRQVILDHMRNIIEELIDLDGNVYYIDRRLNQITFQKPLVFRDEIIRPSPTWELRRNAGTGQLYYHNPSAPWRSTPNPPPSMLLCGVCHYQLADRRCHGHECDGLPYCYSCWEEQHPVAVEEYRAHESHVERLVVMKQTCSTTSCNSDADLVLWEGPTHHYPCYCNVCYNMLPSETRELPTVPLKGRTAADVLAALAAQHEAQQAAQAYAASNAASGYGAPEFAWGEDIAQW